MSNVIVKESPHKIDPKNPERTDPTWKRAYEKGQQVLKKGGLKFNNGGEKEYYEKMLRANPANINGLPITHPALPNPTISMSSIDMSHIHFDTPKPLPCGHSWIKLKYSTEGKIFSCKYGHEYDETQYTN